MAGIKSLINNESGNGEINTRNKYLEDPLEALNLITSLISAKNTSDEFDLLLTELKKLVEVDFLNIVKKDQCPRSVHAYSQLQKTVEDLSNIVNFPELENKFFVAIGGQFSSGKSRFLNTVIGTEKLLPTDTTPTTYIPTYVLSGKEDTFFALNKYLKKTTLDSQSLNAITHTFKDKYLGFGHILKQITIELKSFNRSNIVFLDTPGYSKSELGGQENNDKKIAFEHLRTADYLIWLIDIINGDIPETDIAFIKRLQYDIPTLFVLNKADGKIEPEINKIMNKTKKTLKNKDIRFIDVIAYSSMDKVEYPKGNNQLKIFLDNIDKETPGTSVLINAEEIFEEYLSYHKTEIEFLKNGRGALNDTILYFDKLSHSKDDAKYIDKLKNIAKKHSDQKEIIEKSLIRLQKFHENFITKIKSILEIINVKEAKGTILKRRKDINETILYRFNAIIEFKDKIDHLPDFKNINGIVKNISSIGVTIDIKDGNGTAIINPTEFKNKPNYKGLFSLGSNVKVQYIDKKKAIIEVENNME